MFRLVGADLPTAKKEPVRVVPAIRVWQGQQRGLGVLARINTYANYTNPGFDVKQLEIPRPIASGFFFQSIPPFTFKSPALEGFQFLSDPTTPLPKTLWVGSGVINIYASNNTSPSPFVLTLLTGVPLPTQPITLPTAFTVTSVTYQGLSVTFTQQGVELRLGNEYQLGVGDELEIAGTYAVTPQLIYYVATFLFSDFDYLDRFDYMGTNYIPAPDATNPKVGQFIWSENLKLCTVFSHVQFDPPTVNWNYLSVPGQLSF